MNQNNRIRQFMDAVSDSEGSEYYHEIYFSGKREPLKGFSGKSGYREKLNSVDNCINYLLRLVKSGYYPGSGKGIEEMCFYNLRERVLMFRLLPGRVIWEPQFALDQNWRKAQKTFDAMNHFIKAGWPLIKIQDHLMVKKNKRFHFDPNDLSFRHINMSALTTFCEWLIEKGYPKGEVEHYFRMYKLKYFDRM